MIGPRTQVKEICTKNTQEIPKKHQRNTKNIQKKKIGPITFWPGDWSKNSGERNAKDHREEASSSSFTAGIDQQKVDVFIRRHLTEIPSKH